MYKLSIGCGGWHFTGGPWFDGVSGEFLHNKGMESEKDEPWLDLDHAFYIDKAYGDAEIRFGFSRKAGHCGAGLIVRAQDARHYYVIEFPFCGQQIREGHFWAAVLRVDGSGWGKALMCERVPGVPCEAGIRNEARVALKGDTISLWVNGRHMPPVCDSTYPSSGHIGIVEWGGCILNDLLMEGEEKETLLWDKTIKPVENWFYPYPDTGTSQSTTGLIRTADGDLLMTINKTLMRSNDLGRTWRPGVSDMEGTLAKAKDGSVLIMRVSRLKPFIIEEARSFDNGRTFLDYEQVGELNLPEPDDEAYIYGSILELSDGGLLCFGMAYKAAEMVIKDGRRYRGAQTPGMMNFCIRSDDCGYTWSDPVDIDGTNPIPAQWMNFKDGCSEVTAMETKEGEIIALIRPGTAWAMWETRSKDGGRTWSPVASGPFLSYACAAPIKATASGTLIIGGRFPGLAVRVSYDSGMTWDTYQIDTEAWAMGGMYEVAPDVVLWVYGSCSSRLRGQFIKIGPDGARPMLEMLPQK